ncbi:aspartate kinase [Rhodovulum sp. DZ06]|uniref:aspartate kinase n=1 Tax=Rhodovulum sp. DZ06 TaxID=3425126 RepID=UPI003D33F63A
MTHTPNAHTVEKIGGTSMSRTDELIDTLLIGGRDTADVYGRVFVVSAYGGMTDKLLENKKTGAPGVYGAFAGEDGAAEWMRALDEAMAAMIEVNARLVTDPADREIADNFVRERIEGARNCLIDLGRLCSYGHFKLDEHLMTVRELLSGLGEAHSAHNTALLLRRRGVNARFIDLSGWRDETSPDLEQRIAQAFEGVDFASQMPIVTGYAQCREGLVSTFDRGYSEVTFSRIAAQTGAREAVIHKEFHLSSADPKIVGHENVRKIGRTNYDVADQLSNLGMEAIHPRAAKTLRQAGIPLRVANAFEPEDPGTVIDAELGGPARVEMVTGLDVTEIEVFEQDMVGVKGYDAEILKALARHKLWIVAKSSNANTITHYVQGPLKRAKRVAEDVAEAFPAARVRARRLALVSAIGRELTGLGPLRRALTACDSAGIEVSAAQENGRGVDVMLMVPCDRREDAIRALHAELVEGEAWAAEAADAPVENDAEAVESAPRALDKAA